MYRYAHVAGLLFVLFVFGIFAVMLLSAGAAAQNGGNVTAATPAQEVERIDTDTVILNSSYNDQAGIATVIIESEVPQQVTVTDAGAFSVGGTVERRQVRLDPREPTKISLPVTEVNGRVGLGIETRQKLYGHIIEVPNYLFYSDPGWGTVRLVGFGSGFGVLGAVVLEVFRRKFWQRNQVRKIA
jgi:hypothetical protein